MLQAVVGLRGVRRGERIGLEKVDAGSQILPPDIANDVGAGQGQKVVVAFQLMAMIAEAEPTKIVLVELVALDQHTPRAVEQENALSRLFQHPTNARLAIETHDGPFGCKPMMRQAA